MKKRLLEHFGIDQLQEYRGKKYQSTFADICHAIHDNELIAISGPVGSGKTTLVNDAISSVANGSLIKYVYVRNFFKEKLTIGGIINAIILDLSDESPRRDLEARSRQVVRLLGRTLVTEKTSICVVIEEAHRLHFNTLRSIKELREATFAGVTPLFSVILIGHPELSFKLEKRKEVYWRSSLFELSEANGWMTFEERINYLKVRFGNAISGDARKRIAALAKVPLEMDVFVEARMKEAYAAGMHILTKTCIEVSAREMKESLGVSLKQISAESGIARTTVHDVLTGAGSDQSRDAVKKALDRIAAQREDSAEQAVAI